MATIAELIGGSDSESLNVSAMHIRMAHVMKCDVNKVKAQIALYGPGYIYTSGLIMPDTPRNRGKLVDMYGDVAILLEDGNMVIRTPKAKGQLNRKRKEKEGNIERHKYKKEVEQYREKRRIEKLFADGQTQPSPKRQGQCRGIPCNYIPATSYYDTIPRSQDVFRVVNVNCN